MKEKYVKPLIIFESFAFSQTIAENCGAVHGSTLGEPNHGDPSSCNWIMGNLELFYVEQCADADAIGEPEPGDEIEFEGICYNNPNGGQSFFSSL